jgi:hypothetical protein
MDSETTPTGTPVDRFVMPNLWKLKRTKQCAKCPWRADVDPHEIPNGYSEDKHIALKCTIAREGDMSFLSGVDQHVMACHESHDAHCIGWLMNQVGPGNNIGLRIRMMACENAKDIQLAGEQHETFEETLPSA